MGGRAQLQGRSLVRLLHGAVDPVTFNASFSQIQRPGNVQGLTVRTDRWRYTEWVKFDYSSGRPIFTENNTRVELYDHQEDGEVDFDAYENVNVAGEPGNDGVVKALAAALKQRHDPEHLMLV